jgi:hypothetical protein
MILRLLAGRNFVSKKPTQNDFRLTSHLFEKSKILRLVNLYALRATDEEFPQCCEKTKLPFEYKMRQ